MIKKILISLIPGLVTIVTLTAITLTSPPKTHAQSGTCVLEAQSVSNGSLTFSCEDRKQFTVTAFTGGPCTPPTAGIVLYTSLPDGTCLPIKVVPAIGFVASNIQTWTDKDATGKVNAQVFFARLTPQ